MTGLAEPAGLASLLPDVPRFVETRWMLLEGRCDVLGLREDRSSMSFVACGVEEELACVVGRPDSGAIAEAVARIGGGGEVLAMPENVSRVAEVLPDLEAQPVAAHLLGGEEHLPETPQVRLLSGLEKLRDVSQELSEELARALRQGRPLAAAFVEGRPVSFCYVAAETEGLWDVSIDTLDEYRRQGYAASCAAFMIRYMRALGKEPVWHALRSNLASMGLAARLGFVVVDGFYFFELAGDAREAGSPSG